MNECVFCDVVAGVRPGVVVAQTPHVVAFMDVLQCNEAAHVLVVPRQHIVRASELSAELWVQVQELVRQCVNTVAETAAGVNVFLNDGPAAGQEVPHAHWHVIGRCVDDGLRIKAPWKLESQEQLSQRAQSAGLLP